MGFQRFGSDSIINLTHVVHISVTKTHIEIHFISGATRQWPRDPSSTDTLSEAREKVFNELFVKTKVD